LERYEYILSISLDEYLKIYCVADGNRFIGSLENNVLERLFTFLRVDEFLTINPILTTCNVDFIAGRYDPTKL